ncbi:MAG: cell division protein FtsW [Phycisphaera sp. TMED9]|nr:MAG: cell division protein FtsW [Phycisphaera sp. TMED9]
MRAGQIVALLVVTLFVFGVVMVNSASLHRVEDPGNTIRLAGPDHTYTLNVTESTGLAGRRVTETLLGKQTQFAAVAIIALIIGACIPIERLSRMGGLVSPVPWILAAILCSLLLTFTPLGVTMHGAQRWIRIGPLQFQPSEVAKWGLPFIIAWHCVRHAPSMRRFTTGLLPPLVLSGLICGLIAKEDLGTAVLIMSVAVMMLLVAGARWWHILALLPLGLIAFVGLVLAEPYRVRRIMAFLDPYADAQDSGYQLVQSLGSIVTGGVAGVGFGNSVQKNGYLPETQTDFIFAIICEELGTFGAAMLIALFAGLVLVGTQIVLGRSTPAALKPDVAARAVPRFSRILGFGIVLTFGLQAVINLAVVTGLAPTKGIALPLVSRGGTGWILTAFSLGLIISMDRRAWRISREAGLDVQERTPLPRPETELA